MGIKDEKFILTGELIINPEGYPEIEKKLFYPLIKPVILNVFIIIYRPE